MIKNTLHILFFVLFAFLLQFSIVSADDLLNIKSGTITVKSNAIFTVSGTVNISSGATLKCDTSGTINVAGDWKNSGTFTPSGGTVVFFGGAKQTIYGSTAPVFNKVNISKTNDTVKLTTATTINGNLRFFSNTILDMVSYDLTMGAGADIYSDSTTGQSFGADKCILKSVNDTTHYLTRKITQGVSAPLHLLFPLGTPGVYTPAAVDFLASSITSFGANAYVKICPVSSENPHLIRSGIALTKYWKLATNAIVLDTAKTNLYFTYDESEVPPLSSEGNYIPLLYVANTGSWNVSPGQLPIVNSTTNFIKSENSPLKGSYITGDWTAGEPEAAVAVYYSLGGAYNQASSWSNENYGGTPSTLAPGLAACVIKIGDGKTIWLTDSTKYTHAIYVEQSGIFLTDTFVVNGTRFELQPHGILGIGSAQGITATSTSGNIRTSYRVYSNDGHYMYTNGLNQVTGDGLPLIVHALKVNKTAGTVKIQNNIQIADTLYIMGGTIDDNYFSLSGQVPNRILLMTGGTYIVRNNFPQNYYPPTFTAGTIRFDGTAGLDVPASGTTPGVLQYNNLIIAGYRSINTVNFGLAGEIRIKDTFDISGTTFQNTGGTDPVWLTSGSTIVFNGTGNQNIPHKPGIRVAADWTSPHFWLKYYNVKISGSGTKTLSDTLDYVILKNLDIENSTFSVGTKNLEVRGNWTNTSGHFTAGGKTVSFNPTAISDTILITSNLEPFYNLYVLTSPGVVKYIDDLNVDSNLTIGKTATFGTISSTLTLGGNWIDSSTYIPGTGEVIFSGGITNQPLLKYPTGTETFYNLTISKSASNVRLAAGTNVTVNSGISFYSGNLDARTNSDTVIINGVMSRSGTGYIDGIVKLLLPVGAQSFLIPIGNSRGSDAYTPIQFTLNGSDGTQGYVNFVSDTILSTGNSAFVSGSNLDPSKNVLRKWKIYIPTGSSFALGTRNFDLTTTFINPGDIRGSADPLLFQTNVTTNANGGGNWTSCITGTRTSYSTKSLSNTIIGTPTNPASYIIGFPNVLTLYSIVDNGNFSDRTTWSTEGYGGATAPPSVTITGSNNYRIGNGVRVVLDASFAISSGKEVVVESYNSKRGLLDCGTNVLSGGGSFRLLTNGALGIGSAVGITAAATSGNIQTTTRSYNDGSHYRGQFIYNGSVAQVTGDALPDTVRMLTINSSNTVTLSKNLYNVVDTLYIQTGTLSTSTFNIGLKGNWRNTGTFTGGSGTVTFFNGTSNQTIVNANGETFTNLVINKSSGKVLLGPLTDITITNALTLTAGTIDARTNVRKVISTSTTAGSITRTGGFIDGELRRTIPTGVGNRDYYIGAGTSYTPANVEFVQTNTGVGTQGLVGVIAVGSNHPQFSHASNNLDSNLNVQRYWTLSSDTVFAIGGRTTSFSATFLNPDDLRGGATPTNFQMRQWNGGTWNSPDSNFATSNTTKGVKFLDFGGDFVVSEPAASLTVYYSRANGSWGNASSWSTTGFGESPASSYPNGLNHIVFIGNGNQITLDSNRTLRCVTIEKNNK